MPKEALTNLWPCFRNTLLTAWVLVFVSASCVFGASGCQGIIHEGVELKTPLPIPDVLSRTDLNPARGYQPRHCGFDLDHDGEIGEPEDDCNLCDGETIFDNKDLIYVDCALGEAGNLTGNGSPDQPYGTIQHAWNAADGPGNGKADVVCFTGYCAEDNIKVGTSGVAGAYTKPRSGSEARDWEFPSNPAMLVGWDKDNDGSYPPLDISDHSVLDGRSFTNTSTSAYSTSYAIDNTARKNYVEYAHFTAVGYGQNRKAQDSSGHVAGFMRWGGSHQYIHDLYLKDILKDSTHDSHHHIFNSFTHPRGWMAVVNVFIANAGGYLTRGESNPSTGDIYSNFRFQNISYVAHPIDMCSMHTYSCTKSNGEVVEMENCRFTTECENRTMEAGSATISKLWNYRNIEWIDNVFDTNIDAYVNNSERGLTGIVINRHLSDVTIRNNEFIDYRQAIFIKENNEKIVIDSNVFRSNFEWDGIHTFVEMQKSSNTGIRITNNIFVEKSNRGAQFILNNDSCELDVVHNTFIGNAGGHTIVNAAFPHCGGTTPIYNNLFDVNTSSPPVSGRTHVANNVYANASSIGEEGTAIDCSAEPPAYRDPSEGDYRLGEGDICMQRVVPNRRFQFDEVAYDIEGQERSENLVDAGADLFVEE